VAKEEVNDSFLHGKEISTMKKNMYLLELSDVFANQVYLPYSTGVVASYAFANQAVADNYELKKWFYYRQPHEEIVSEIHEPDVIGFSCFIWNWNINLKIAKGIKEKYPGCLIVFGGQQQPLADRVGNFFEDHPYVDILVHGEGEVTFVEILEQKLAQNPDYKSIAGITFFDGKVQHPQIPRSRLKDIKSYESPYLNGFYDKLVSENDSGLEYSAIVESARGCPFQCAFCEIGEKYYTKVYKNYDKIKQEIDWITENKIEYITDANSNYGMYYDLDMDLSLYVKSKKEETGYPHAFRVTWVKGQADRVLEIAKVLEDAGCQKGMTIALQSMNADVLKAVKRKNVDGGKLKEFVEMYESKNISSYVELIWGLPEETVETFVDGVCKIIELDYHNYLDIHLMTALVNTPFSRPEFINKYGIEVSVTQPRFHHRHIDGKLSEDTSKFVTKTDTFTHEQWLEGHQFRWLVIFGHYLGPTQFISRFLRNHLGITYKQFYTSLLEYVNVNKDKGSFLSDEHHLILHNMKSILQNDRHWGIVVPEVSEINWSVDESTAIKVALDYESFEKDITNFLINHLKISLEEEVLQELLMYQHARLNHPRERVQSRSFGYNIHNVIEQKAALKKEQNDIEFIGSGIQENYEWAKKVLWHSRRTGGYKSIVQEVVPVKSEDPL
tara:strand:+ start:12568 stop:14574 length:2007 start_codon:yes stop_codon:yes gene_type:complete